MTCYFLTAIRNESRSIPIFIDEFTTMVRGLRGCGTLKLVVVDDYSQDGSAGTLTALSRDLEGVEVEVIAIPTNLGNQGALYFGLQQLAVAADDCLVTFDCDGEDDVRAIPDVIEVGRCNPGKAVFIERARRKETALFRGLFWLYKWLFRRLTGNTVVPNNFMLLPGTCVPAVKRSTLAAAHFAYGVLRLGIPYVAIARDRRPRYAGRSSQNISTLVSHGMVGLMVFFEVVLGKLFLLGFGSVVAGFVLLLASNLMPRAQQVLHAITLSLAVAAWAGGVILVTLMLASALALLFKIVVYQLHAGSSLAGSAVSSTTVTDRPRHEA